MDGFVHAMIVSKAIDLLGRSGREVYAAWGNQGVANLCEGVLYADSAGRPQYVVFKVNFLCGAAEEELGRIDLTNTASNEHYYDPISKAGLNLSGMEPLDFAADLLADLLTTVGTLGIVSIFVDVIGLDLDKQYRSAAECCKDHYDRALLAWRGDPTIWPTLDRRSAAMRELGWACHFIGDLCTSPHTISRPPLLIFFSHRDYESFAAEVIDYDKPYQHADDVEEELLQSAGTQGADKIAETVAEQTRGEYDLFLAGMENDAERGAFWATALATAIPRAERYTAILLAKFFGDVGISEEPLPLIIKLVTPEQTPIAHAMLFFRSLAILPGERRGSKHWKMQVADEGGIIHFCAHLGNEFDLLPAMPGYIFEGNHYGDYGEGDIVPPSSPIRYVHRAMAGSTPIMYIVLRRLRQVLAVPPQIKSRSIPVQLGWQLGRSIFAAAQKESGISHEEITAGRILDKIEQRAAAALDQQLDVDVLDDNLESEPYLAPGSDVIVRIALSSLVDVESGDFVRSRKELEKTVQRKIMVSRQPPTKGQLPTWSESVRDAWKRLPKVKVKLPDGTIGSARQLTPPSSSIGELTKINAATALPAPLGAMISVEIIGGTGCVSVSGGAIRVEVKTDRSGVALVRIRAGSERGLLRLKIAVLKAQNIPAEMLPKPRWLDLVAYPGLDGAADVIPATPPSLWVEKRKPHHYP